MALLWWPALMRTGLDNRSLTAAMIDRVDCPAKQRDRIRMGTIHYASGNTPTGALGSVSTSSYVSEQGTGAYPAASPRQWPSGITGNSGSLPALNSTTANNGWTPEQDAAHLPSPGDLDENLPLEDEQPPDESYNMPDYQQREPYRPYQGPYGQTSPTGPLGSNTGPLGYPTAANQHTSTGTTGHMPALNASGGSNTIVQSTVVQSTVDLNMLMDIIETVFDRPTITTFVLMTGDKDFTRISARLKLRLNKTVIVVGIPGTVSRDLISSANQFVPLVPGGVPAAIGISDSGFGSMSMTGNTGSMAAITTGTPTSQLQPYPMDALDPQLLQFLDYIDRNWSWRTIIGVSNFIGDPVNPKNRFRGRLTRDSARELLNSC